MLSHVVSRYSYEPDIEIVDIGHIGKSTSGITGAWPFETVTVTLDPDEFNDATTDRKIKITLLDDELLLDLREQSLPEYERKVTLINESGIYILKGPDFHRYSGKVCGKVNSTVTLTIHKNLMFGTIDVDNNPYFFVLTRKSIAGKPVVAIYRQENVIVYDYAAEWV